MPKAILEFNLPEDERDHLRAVKSSDAFIALEEIHEYLRRRFKHEDSRSSAHYEEYETIRDEIYRIIEDNNIPDELLYY